MNAAARLVHQNVLSRHVVLTHFLNRQQYAALLLGLLVLFSALSTIYLAHVTRIMHANYQHSLTERDRLYVQQGQLLLERSTELMQSRVQQIAENKLGMVIPDHHSVVIIRE